jgi:transposase-like protein
MSKTALDHQVCPACRSPHTHCAGHLGQRSVWRCSGCGRTFWPKEKGSWIMRCLKALLRVQQV